jgi:hypothetical protein
MLDGLYIRARCMATVTVAAGVLATSCSLFAPVAADASQLVDRNVSHARLQVDRHGVALVTYNVTGQRGLRHVLYWGGVNWTLRFRYDRSGGWQSHIADWRRFHNVCRPYTGPRIHATVAACTAPDGSYWALQSWARLKRDWGGRSAPSEMNISHWTGAMPRIWVGSNWGWHGRFVASYGQYTFHGRPVRVSRHSPTGVVLDGKGRNVAIDAWASDFGAGWARVNMILAGNPNGQFCYDFSPKGHGPYSGRSPSGQYRISAQGPGVAPDIVNQLFAGQTGPYDPIIQAQAAAAIRRLVHGAPDAAGCRPLLR